MTEARLSVRLVAMYPPAVHCGGFEHQCIQTAQALARQGHDAKLLNWHDPKEHFHCLHLFGSTSAWFDISNQARGRFAVVISVLGGGKGRQRLLSLANRVGSLACKLIPRQQTDYDRRRAVVHRADRLVAVNEMGRAFICGLYQIDPAKVAVVPNGVPASRFSGEPDLFRERYGIHDYVLSVGHILPGKNSLLLANVLKKKEIPGVFVGTMVPSEPEYAARFATVIESAPNLHWIQGLPYDDPMLDAAYAGARLLCHPSVKESQPLAVMEAMAAGLPVILGDKPYAHQSPFENAVRCPALTEDALSDCLDEVLGEPETYRSSLSKKYLWKNIAAELVQVYEQVLAQKRSQ